MYSEELGCTLHALTRDEWGTEPVLAAGEPGDADEDKGGDVSSVDCDSSSDVDDDLVAAMWLPSCNAGVVLFRAKVQGA